MRRFFPKRPRRLVSAAPGGKYADAKLGLATQLVSRDNPEEDDPLGLAAVDPRDAALDDTLRRVLFRRWLDQRRPRVQVEFARFDCVTSFWHYLDIERLTIHAACEYDLRMYLYQHIPMVEPFPAKVPQTRTVLRSIALYFEYLGQECGVTYPWATALLKDEVTFVLRWLQCPGDDVCNPLVYKWLAVLHEDLDARVFMPSTMDGWEEAASAARVPGLIVEDDGQPLSQRLYVELARRWLVWREDVIAAGVTSPVRVRAILERRQREWETHPHPGLGGETPVQELRNPRKSW